MHKWWQEINLKDMSSEQWESICDRCGLCCLNKLQDDESDEVFYTTVSCKLLDTGKCQCSSYAKRKQIVPDCINLTYKQLKTMLINGFQIVVAISFYMMVMIYQVGII